MEQSILMTRSDVSKYLGISKKSVIRLEEKKKLKAIKLNDSEKGCVYYKRSQVEGLIEEKS